MKAPEFPNNLRWLHGGPLKMKDLRGKAVLIDFWTYSCVNCLRTVPHMKRWHERYAKLGLVIVGVHTPEFEFEHEVEHVDRAIAAEGITWPVVLDNDYQIWSLYSNQVWPRKFLIDKDGQMVFDHEGEGAYKETEEAIQKALLGIDPRLALPAIAEDDGSGGVCYPMTAETYLGTLRGRPGKIWNFQGVWKTYPEYIAHERKTDRDEDYLSLKFDGTEVNLVMESRSDRPAKIRLELNGEFLRDIEVKEAKMYNLIPPRKYIQGGELKIFARDEGFRAFAFTFSGCIEEEKSAK